MFVYSFTSVVARVAYCLTLLVFISIGLSACGGGSSGNNSTDPLDNSETERTSEDGEPTEGDDGPATPEPKLVNIESSCPAIGAADSTVINSWFRYEFSEDIAAAGLSDLSLVLRCDGADIDGTQQILGNVLSFKPKQNLPPGSSCVLEIPAVHNPDFQFDGLLEAINTNNGVKRSLAFNEPKLIYRDWPIITPREVIVSGDTVALLYTTGTTLHISVSYDGGETYSLNHDLDINAIGHIGGISAREYNGELYIAYQVAIANWGIELIYTRSLNGLSEFTVPSLISSLEDNMKVMSHDLAVLSEDNIVIVWEDTCRGFDDICADSATHLLNLALAGDQISVNSYEQLTGPGNQRINTFTVGGELFVSYVEIEQFQFDNESRIETLRMFKYADEMEEIHSYTYQSPFVSGLLTPYTPLYLNDTSVFFLWEEVEAPLHRTYHYQTYTAGDHSMSEPKSIWTSESPGKVGFPLSLTTDHNNRVAWIEARKGGTDFDNWVVKTLDVSTEKRATYPIDYFYVLDPVLASTVYQPKVAFFGKDEFIMTWSIEDETGEEEWLSDPNNSGPFPDRYFYEAKGKIVDACQ